MSKHCALSRSRTCSRSQACAWKPFPSKALRFHFTSVFPHKGATDLHRTYPCSSWSPPSRSITSSGFFRFLLRTDDHYVRFLLLGHHLYFCSPSLRALRVRYREAPAKAPPRRRRFSQSSRFRRERVFTRFSAWRSGSLLSASYHIFFCLRCLAYSFLSKLSTRALERGAIPAVKELSRRPFPLTRRERQKMERRCQRFSVCVHSFSIRKNKLRNKRTGFTIDLLI